MRGRFKSILMLALCLAFASLSAWAGEAMPIGLWRNLDDASGKPHPTQDGQPLSVRGDIGVPVLGRTQTWVRQDKEAS